MQRRFQLTRYSVLMAVFIGMYMTALPCFLDLTTVRAAETGSLPTVWLKAVHRRCPCSFACLSLPRSSKKTEVDELKETEYRQSGDWALVGVKSSSGPHETPAITHFSKAQREYLL